MATVKTQTQRYRHDLLHQEIVHYSLTPISSDLKLATLKFSSHDHA